MADMPLSEVSENQMLEHLGKMEAAVGSGAAVIVFVVRDSEVGVFSRRMTFRDVVSLMAHWVADRLIDHAHPYDA